MKVVSLQAESGEVVPASHVLARCRQSGHLSKNLEQAIVVEPEKTRMVLVELLLHRTIEEFHVGVGKGGERSIDGNETLLRSGPCGQGACRIRGGSRGGGGLQERAPANRELHGAL